MQGRHPGRHLLGATGQRAQLGHAQPRPCQVGSRFPVPSPKAAKPVVAARPCGDSCRAANQGMHVGLGYRGSGWVASTTSSPSQGTRR